MNAIPRSSTPEDSVVIGDTLEEFCGNSEVYYVDTNSAEDYEYEEYDDNMEGKSWEIMTILANLLLWANIID